MSEPAPRKKFFDDLLTAYSVRILVGLLIAFMALTVVSLGAYWYVFHGDLSRESSKWGEFGSYISGTITAVLGPVTVFALLVSQASQRKQMREAEEDRKAAAEAMEAQRKASALQAFEQTFFSWLGTYRDLLGEIQSEQEGGTDAGRKALFNWWVDNLTGDRVWHSLQRAPELARSGKQEYQPFVISSEAFASARERIGKSYLQPYGDGRCVLVLPPEQRVVASNLSSWRWERLYQRQQYQLDNLFRILYRLIVWIDSQDSTKLIDAEKWFYVSIVRGQLSWVELAFLFLNGFTERGRKFKALAEKYALFDNLTVTSDPILENMKEYPPETSGVSYNIATLRYADEAFDSRLARQKLGLPAESQEFLREAL